MSTENLYELASLIRRERDTLLAEWRHEVRQLSVAHNLDVPTLNDHIPDLLEELGCEPVRDLRPLADASNLSLTNEIPEGLAALADASMLSLIFQNLISNAIDHTPNGEVIIGATAGEGPPAVECWVADNGAGIPADRLEKVFDKLESDPDKKGGMGLGLAIVRQFVEAHGGRVSVESKLGQGSTFRFTIPSGAGQRENNSTGAGYAPEKANTIAEERR